MFTTIVLNDIEILQSDQFSRYSDIIHGFSTRTGGVSKHPFDSLNLGMGDGDSGENIMNNRQRFGEVLGFSPEQLVHASQIHSGNVAIANQPGSIPETDAVIATACGIMLSVKTADCVPVLFYEPEHHVVAAVHAGWKGMISNIIANTILLMKKKFICNPHGIIAALGPAIRTCCYEVGNDVAGHFSESEIEEHDGRKYLNLPLAVKYRIKACGIPEENIDDCQRCTFCEPERFFSYRRDGKDTGRIMSVIGLRK